MTSRAELIEFAHHETNLLNEERYKEWLDLLTADFDYRMPAPVIRDDPALDRYSATSLLAWESLHSLKLRFDRIVTDFAWADRPPAFQRRHLTAVRVAPREAGDAWELACDMLVFRSRVPEGSRIVSALRRDVVRLDAGVLRLARRTVLLDADRPDLAQISLLY